MKKATTTLLTILGVLFILIVIATLISPEEKQEEESYGNAMHTLYDRSFMNECAEDEENLEYCQCFLNYLKDKHGYDRMIYIGNHLEEDASINVMLNAADACME